MKKNMNRDLIGKSYETLFRYISVKSISPNNVIIDIHKSGSSKISIREMSAEEVKIYINLEEEAIAGRV
jgi:hypothetical protein